jgi:tetratricopeptide (TPR) repeat protein
MKRFVILLGGAWLLWQASAFAQSAQSQPVTKEVAEAIQLEAQAASLASQGRIVEAETLYKRSLAIVEQALPASPILAGSLNNFGQFYRGQRRYSEAADHLGRALAIYAQSYGDNHKLTATVINNLAAVYQAAGRYDEAEPLYRRGLGATEKLLGAEHYSVALSLDWLAQTNFSQRKYSESEANLRRAVAIAEKSTGPESKLVVLLLDHLVSVVKAQGRADEASTIRQRAQLLADKLKK